MSIDPVSMIELDQYEREEKLKSEDGRGGVH